jgi:hypothetical protein
MARQQELSSLRTFHERNGDQRLASGAGPRTAAWGRLFGETINQSHSGTLSAHLDAIGSNAGPKDARGGLRPVALASFQAE